LAKLKQIIGGSPNSCQTAQFYWTGGLDLCEIGRFILFLEWIAFGNPQSANPDNIGFKDGKRPSPFTWCKTRGPNALI